MRAGMDEATGQIVTGWDHVRMVIRRVLTTRPAALVLRRRIGSKLPALQDENMTAETILRAYVAVAEALSPLNPNWGEPGFRLRSIELAGVNGSGQAGFILRGDYYPRGHAGDYTLRDTGSTTIPVREVV
jgi:uncharacterized protein